MEQLPIPRQRSVADAIDVINQRVDYSEDVQKFVMSDNQDICRITDAIVGVFADYYFGSDHRYDVSNLAMSLIYTDSGNAVVRIEHPIYKDRGDLGLILILHKASSDLNSSADCATVLFNDGISANPIDKGFGYVIRVTEKGEQIEKLKPTNVQNHLYSLGL